MKVVLTAPAGVGAATAGTGTSHPEKEEDTTTVESEEGQSSFSSVDMIIEKHGDIGTVVEGDASGNPALDPAVDSDVGVATDIGTGTGTGTGTEISPQVTAVGSASAAAEDDLQQSQSQPIPQPITPESTKEIDSAPVPNLPIPEITKQTQQVTSRSTIHLPVPSSSSSSSEANSGKTGHLGDSHNAKPSKEAEETNSQSQRSRSRRSRSRRYDEDDALSSDDDSYFSKNMPTAKSQRSFSYDYSNPGSVPGIAANFFHNNSERESDASLSFSDESDDDHHQQTHDAHALQPEPMVSSQIGMVGDMNLFPQRITRMHSVSSLVSSGSSNNAEDEANPPATRSSASSVSSYGTSATTSDRSIRAELCEVGEENRPSSQATDMSGRRSPVMGHKGVPGYFYHSTPSPVISPPTIMQGYAPTGVSYPVPQPMSQEQMTAWIVQRESSTNGGQGYGSLAQQAPLGAHDGGFRNVASSGGMGTNGGPPAPSSSGPSSHRDNQSGLSSGNGPDQSQWNHGVPQQNRNVNPSTAPMKAVSGSSQENMKMERRQSSTDDRGHKVYWQRWIMLLYMSILNLLSDWTCYSVAPISLLTEEAFGNIDPERLVVVFLGANAMASISEPIILSRLGLRRTVLFGSLLLMIGSIVKSGGVPPILQSDIAEGESAWRLYLGFFLVGLSQPLYQCTPTLLSSSWFPEEERTMATGVALNANQLGIGFAFVFGTLLVAKKDDIIPYFGLLSTISTIVFMGTLIQFDDAPPTPPSASARVVRGSFDVKLPSINTIVQSVRDGFSPNDDTEGVGRDFGVAATPSPATNDSGTRTNRSTRRRGNSRSSAIKDNGLMAPSSAQPGSTEKVIAEMARMKEEAIAFQTLAPSPMMSGGPDGFSGRQEHGEENGARASNDDPRGGANQDTPPDGEPHHNMYPMYPGYGMPPQGMPHGLAPQGMPPGMPPGMMPPPPYYPYMDPRSQQMQQHAQHPSYYPYQQHAYPQPPHPYYFPHGAYPPPHLAGYDVAGAAFPQGVDVDDGAEPILTITPHHLDIDIRDDQVIRSLKACFARQGFIHALVAFTASGIVINTLSTYMDYLVRLNGAPRAYTGIVGGAFQFIIMISSLIIGKFTDKSRAYYSVTIGMLVLGAFGLAECGVSLDSDRGNDLRWCLVIVAVLVGPLQPVSTELGVDVVYPLSENTVLVIQQLFSNLLSACFIPVFKALKDVGSQKIDDTDMLERPQYTFSFYLLIVIHTAATVFFATFNGKYLRYEHELERKAEEQEQDLLAQAEENSKHPFYRSGQDETGERRPLMSHPV